jgi:predicted anti-sigma-YlaC factor YlaD
MNSNASLMLHVDDEHLAALNDSELPEREAEQVRKHLAGCQDCRTRNEQLAALVDQLAVAPTPNPDMVRRVNAQISAPPAVEKLRWLWMAGTPALAAAAVAVFVLLPGDGSDQITEPTQDDGWQARGDHSKPESVQLTLFRAGEKLERVEDGDTLSSGTQKLSVAVKHLPADTSRSFAVYAREAAGRVTWIRPTWTDPKAIPTCLPIPSGAGVLAPTEGVELQLDPGQVEIGFVVLSKKCDIPALDQKLEAGWAPRVGSDNVLIAHQLKLTIAK